MAASAPLIQRPGSTFVGRARELGLLEHGLASACAGRGSLFLVTGEPGIGKTRLAAEIEQRAAERGVLAVWGRCWEAGTAPAFWPWTQIVRACCKFAPDIAATSELQDQLTVLLAERSMAASPESEQSRFWLFDACCRFLQLVAQVRPLVLLLDDIHVADTPSLQLLRFLARDLSARSILLVATCRDAEMQHLDDRREILQGLVRDGRRVALHGLERDEVASLCVSVAERNIPSSLIATVHEITEGNPFFVDEVMRLLVADGTITRPSSGQRPALRVPSQVRDVIRQRLASLDAEAQRVLAVAAVVGREIDERVIEMVVGDERSTAVFRVLRAATRLEILNEVPGSPGRYRFAHMLITDTLYHDLVPEERRLWHATIGNTLEQVYGNNPEAHLTELAHHFCRARLSEAPKAFFYAVGAAEHATKMMAFEEAARWYEQALQIVDVGGGTPVQRCDLKIRAAEAHRYAGDHTPAIAACKQAAVWARELGDPALLARAAVALGHAAAETGVVNATLVGLLEEALANLPAEDSPLRVAVLARLAVALYFSPSRERRIQVSLQALEIARRLQDNSALAQALATRHFALWEPRHTVERLTLANDLLKLGEHLHDHDIVMDGLSWRVSDKLEVGDVVTATADLETFVRLATEHRRIRDRWHGALLHAALALFHGHIGKAEELSRQALALGQHGEAENAAPFFGVQTFLQHHARGNLDVLGPTIQDLAERHPTLPIWRCGLALLWCESGHLQAAAAELDRLACQAFRDFPRDLNWLPSLCLLAEVCAALDDSRRAADLQELLAPFAANNVVIATGAGLLGSVTYFLAHLAATQGAWSRADNLFAQAVAANTAMGASLWVAHTRYAWAELRVKSGSTDINELTQAKALAAETRSTASTLGMQRLEQLARVLEADLGRRLAATSYDADTDRPRQPQVLVAIESGGEYWTLRSGETDLRLKDSKGLRYLALLLKQPGTSFYAAHLQGAGRSRADGISIFDPAAKGTYQARLRELHADLDEAQRLNDPGRAVRAQSEIDALANQVAAAAGLGSRKQKSGSEAERARVNVTRAIAAALRRIRAHDENLGRYLAITVRTGNFCVYRPEAFRLSPRL